MIDMKKQDIEEKELMASVERGEWRSAPHAKNIIKQHMRYADNTLKKNRRITIRVSEHDLEQIQEKAVEEGMPYQTLITSVLHKYTSGWSFAKS